MAIASDELSAQLEATMTTGSAPTSSKKSLANGEDDYYYLHRRGERVGGRRVAGNRKRGFGAAWGRRRSERNGDHLNEVERRGSEL